MEAAVSSESQKQAVGPLNSWNEWIMRLVEAGEALKPGPALGAYSKALQTRLWRKTLDEIGAERFEAAFLEVMEKSPYRPDIEEIRRAAGVNAGIIDPVREEALAAMRRVIEAMRRHGPMLAPIKHGAEYSMEPCASCGNPPLYPSWARLESCQFCPMKRPAPTREADVPVPDLGAHTEAAILHLGYADRVAGLQAFAALPCFAQDEPDSSAFRNTKVMEGFEGRWCASWRATA